MTPKEAVTFARDHGVRMVDLKFMDFPGLWQHFSIPISAFDEVTFEDGVGFDDSSIRCWQAVHASDMLVVPDPATAVLDPFTAVPKRWGSGWRCSTTRWPRGGRRRLTYSSPPSPGWQTM